MLGTSVSYSMIVPDKYQELLIHLGSRSSSVSFAIGEATLDIKSGWDTVKRDRPDLAISDAEIYSAIGAFCGKSARTVREYAAIAAFFPAAVRDGFEVLSIDHFRTAMTLGPRWEEALRWAVDEMSTNGGRPATVDKMIARYHVSADMPDENPEPIEPVGPLNSAEVALGAALAEVKVISDFVANVGKLRAILPGAGLSSENVRRAESLLAEILEILSDLKTGG